MYTKLLQAIYRDSDLSEKTASMIEQKVSVYQQKKGQAGKLHWDEEDIFLITYGDQFLKSSNQLCVHLRNFIKSIWQIHLELYISCHFSHIHLMMVSPL